MGKSASYLGCRHSGHSCFAPTALITASANVKINSIGAMRVSDKYSTHCCGPSCHQPVQGTGSSTVIINGKPAGRIGDKTSCGASVMTGSGNVFFG